MYKIVRRCVHVCNVYFYVSVCISLISTGNASCITNVWMVPMLLVDTKRMYMCV